MSNELLTIVVLVAMFVIATTLPVNLGALALMGAFFVGTLALGLSVDEVLFGVVADGEVTGGFPGDIFVLLVGLTYLFALAQDNGTIDRVVEWSMRLVRGRLAAVPWVFFGITAVLSSIGALFAVAIMAPLALPFAKRYGVNLLLMGMMVVHGALGGAFSPISVYGAFVNQTMASNDLPSSPWVLFLTPLAINVVVAVGIYTFLGGRRLLGRRVDPVDPDSEADEGTDRRVTPAQVITLVGIAVLAVVAASSSLIEVDIGFLSLSIAVVIRLATYRRHSDALGQVSWSTLLLICGVITYVGVLQAAGTVEYLSDAITSVGSALLIALLLCYLGGVLSAFASSVAILGVAIPLALPFLQQGEVSAIGMVAALAVASTIVDVSPFSTNGALILANAPAGIDRDRFYRQMLVYAGVVVAIGPGLAWLLLVAPGW